MVENNNLLSFATASWPSNTPIYFITHSDIYSDINFDVIFLIKSMKNLSIWDYATSSQSDIPIMRKLQKPQFRIELLKKIWRVCLMRLTFSYTVWNTENIVNMQDKVNQMNSTQENSYFWKNSIHKVWII